MGSSNMSMGMNSASANTYLTLASAKIAKFSPASQNFLQKIKNITDLYAEINSREEKTVTKEDLARLQNLYKLAEDAAGDYEAAANKRTDEEKKYTTIINDLRQTLLSDGALLQTLKFDPNKPRTIQQMLSDQNKNIFSLKGKIKIDGATMSSRIPLTYVENGVVHHGFFTRGLPYIEKKEKVTVKAEEAGKTVDKEVEKVVEGGEYLKSTLGDLKMEYDGLYPQLFGILSKMSQEEFFYNVVGATILVENKPEGERKDVNTDLYKFKPKMVYAEAMRPTVDRINSRPEPLKKGKIRLKDGKIIEPEREPAPGEAENLQELRNVLHQLTDGKQEPELSRIKETIEDILGRTYETVARNYKSSLSCNKLHIPSKEDIPMRNDMFNRVITKVMGENVGKGYAPETKQMTLKINGVPVGGTYMETGTGLDVKRPKENDGLLEWSGSFETYYGINTELYRKAEDLYFENLAKYEAERKKYERREDLRPPELKDGTYFASREELNDASKREKFMKKVLPLYLPDAALALEKEYKTLAGSSSILKEKFRAQNRTEKYQALYNQFNTAKNNAKEENYTFGGIVRPDAELTDNDAKIFEKAMDSELLKPKTKRVSGKAMQKLADLQVMDFITGSVDRHEENMLYKFKDVKEKVEVAGVEEERTVKVLDDVECIDNDMSFGTIGTINEMDEAAKIPQANKKYTRRMGDDTGTENALENYCSPKSFKYISQSMADKISDMAKMFRSNQEATEQWRFTQKDMTDEVFAAFKSRVIDLDNFIKESQTKYPPSTMKTRKDFKTDADYNEYVATYVPKETETSLVEGYPRVIPDAFFEHLDILDLERKGCRDVGDNECYFTRIFNASIRANDKANEIIAEVNQIGKKAENGALLNLYHKFDNLGDNDTVTHNGVEYIVGDLKEEYRKLKVKNGLDERTELFEASAFGINPSHAEGKMALQLARMILYKEALKDRQVVYNGAEIESLAYRSNFDKAKDTFRNLKAQFADAKSWLYDSGRYKNMMSALNNVVSGFDEALSETEMAERYGTLQAACNNYLSDKKTKLRQKGYGKVRFDLANRMLDQVNERLEFAPNAALTHIQDTKAELHILAENEQDENLKKFFVKSEKVYEVLEENMRKYRDLKKNASEDQITKLDDDFSNAMKSNEAKGYMECMVACEMLLKERRMRRENKDTNPGKVEAYLMDNNINEEETLEDLGEKVHVNQLKEVLGDKLTVVDFCNKLAGFNVKKGLKMFDEPEPVKNENNKNKTQEKEERVFSKKKEPVKARTA